MPHPSVVLPQKRVLRDLLHEVDPSPLLDLEQLVRLLCSQQVRLERRVEEGLCSIIKILHETRTRTATEPLKHNIAASLKRAVDLQTTEERVVPKETSIKSTVFPLKCANGEDFGEASKAVAFNGHASTTSFAEFLSTELAKLQTSILNERQFLNADYTSLRQKTETRSDVDAFDNAAISTKRPEWPSNCSDRVSKLPERVSKCAERISKLPDVAKEEFTSSESSETQTHKAHARQHASVLFQRSLNDIGDKDYNYANSYQTFAESPFFDLLVACVVLLNCVFICVEAQMEGTEVGNDLFGYSTFHFSKAWKLVFNTVDFVFISVYTLEMVFKLTVLRLEFFNSRWNLLDAVTVSVSITAAALSIAGFSGLGVSAIVLRLARLAKIVRLMHILRSMTFFSSFLIMVKSLRASMEALFWSLFFLIGVIATSAFILNQIIIEHLRQKSVEQFDGDTQELFLLYGTFTRTIVTMFEMTLGNWGPPTWVLINHVHELFGFFMICYKLYAGFAMLNVINAVFLRLTMKQADVLDGHAIAQAKADEMKYRQKVSKMFDIMDTSGDGTLSHDEFTLLCESNSLKAWMKLINVSTTDLDGLWRVLDSGDGQIEKERFLDSFAKLKGNATAIDSMMIKAMINDMDHKLSEVSKKRQWQKQTS